MYRLCTLLILFLLLGPGPAGAADVRVITENNPPLNFAGTGGPSGLATDLFLLMAGRAGLKVARKDIQVWPRARGYREIQEKSDVILYAMARTAAREKLFRWIGPIMPLHTSLFALKSRGIVIKDPVKGAWEYRYGTIRSSASEQELIRLGVPPHRLESVHDRTLNIRKLLLGHIDIMVANEPATFYSIRRMDLNPDDFEPVYRLMSSNLYYAASRDLDPALVLRLQSALDGLKADGTAARIIESYR
ncbi:substrate-binding periplasmic protein [Pseudodesulfovibrio methanolicus]|uniref:Transporter substrate-binding domain-containing protein n=1 Tax=Pseudodesulfovibrio methanolicus TaxID=3126690 RepID=A0ABZ2J1T6_9BACT